MRLNLRCGSPLEDSDRNSKGLKKQSPNLGWRNGIVAFEEDDAFELIANKSWPLVPSPCELEAI